MTPAQKAGWEVGDIGWFKPGKANNSEQEKEPVQLDIDDGTGNPKFNTNLFTGKDTYFITLIRVYRSKEQDLAKLRLLSLLGVKE